MPQCPGCQQPVSIDAFECPQCGLSLNLRNTGGPGRSGNSASASTGVMIGVAAIAGMLVLLGLCGGVMFTFLGARSMPPPPVPVYSGGSTTGPGAEIPETPPEAAFEAPTP